MRRRKWMVAGIVVVAIYGVMFLFVSIKYWDLDEVRAASDISDLGLGALKYWVCFGRPPSSGDDLIRCGLLEASDDPQTLVLRGSGYTVKREYAETATFVWPSEHAAWRLAGDTVVDEHGSEMPAIVRLESTPSHRDVDFHQRHLKRSWLALQQRETIDTAELPEWIYDCNDVVSEE